MKRLKIGLVLLALSLIALMIAIGLLTQDSPPTQSAGLSTEEHQALYDAEENGFHALEEAMAEIVPPEKAVQQELDALKMNSDASDATRDYVAKYQEALAKAREGLAAEYLIAPPFLMKQIGSWHSDVLSLSRLFMYDGHIKRIDGDFSGMPDEYLNGLFTGQSVTEAGLLIDSMISIAIERLALGEIYAVLDRLSRTDLSRLIDDLQRYESGVVHIDKIIANEKSFSDEQMKLMQTGIVSKIFSPITRIILNRVTDPVLERSRREWREGNTILLGTTLRARVTLYELEHGEAPESLTDVLDGAKVPIDPITANPFQYTNGKIFSTGARPESVEATEASIIDAKTVF